MTAWATIRRPGLVAAALLLSAVVSPASAADPPAGPTPPRPAKPAQLREIAEKAEKAGDWEAAFSAYCHLYVADRGTPEAREKLNVALRRVQQVRRHRDPNFQQFAAGMSAGAGLDLFAEVVRKVPGTFADREKAAPQNLWAHAVEELDRALGYPAFQQAFLDAPSPEKLDQFRTALRRDWSKVAVTDPAGARKALRKLVLAAQDAFTVRVPAALAIECACGACSGLDEYTVFLTPNAGTEPAGPDLSAAGFYLTGTKDGVAVHGIVPNSWFALSYPNVRRGDRVAKVNGRPVLNMAGVADALQHPNGDGYHTFEFAAAGDGPPSVALIPLSLPTVYGHRLVNTAGTVGYVRVGGFSQTTPGELDAALNALKMDGARVAILDLRGNHGGSFLAGVKVAQRLLPAGLIVTTQGQVPELDNRVYSSASGMSAHDIPLVLLIDSETASAAEVVAAALKDNGRAKLVGMPTFGKGTVQSQFRLALDDPDAPTGKPSKAGTVRVTIARLFSPSGGPINGVGVTPDVLEANEATQLGRAIEKAIEELERGAMPMPSLLLPSTPRDQ
jgi:C-terminal peptidase prc